MFVLLSVYRDILFGRRGPEALPTSEALLIVMVLASVVVMELLLFFARIPNPRGQLELLVSIAMPLSLMWLVLASQQRGERFLQTATAYLGGEVILTTMSIPFASIFASKTVNLAPAQFPPAAQLAGLLLFVAQVWGFWLLSFVVSRALGRSIWIGIAVASLNFMFVMSALLLLFPPPPGALPQ